MSSGKMATRCLTIHVGLTAFLVLALYGMTFASQTHRERNTGWEQSLMDDGITLALSYTGDLFGDVSGGNGRVGRYLHILSGSAHLDLDRLAGIGGGAVYVSGFWTLGDNPSKFVGDVQGVDNIAAPSTVKIFNAQYRQQLFDRRLGLMFGLYDVNSEFDVSERGNLFFNASFGIGPAFSGSGVNGPSIYPTTAPAIRVAGEFSRSTTMRVAVVNGIAGDTEDPYGTRVEFGGGALLVAEIDHHAPGGDDLKLAFGTWTYTALMRSVEDKLSGTLASRTKRSYGFYALGDYPVWQSTGGDREIGVVGRVGHADAGANRVAWFVGGGITFRGSILFQESDNVGIGFVTAVNGGDYKRAMDRLGRPVENAETTIEMTALLGVCTRVSIQPDIQYVINPNTDPAVNNALAMFLRLNVQF